jgi:tetratricopeptide (TPR) repeat protein
MRRLLRCTALWLVALGLHTEAAPKWTQLQSENFLFVGDAPEGQIRRTAERLEQFRETLLRALPGENAPSQAPTVVMVFDTDRSMTPAKPLFNGRPIQTSGVFAGGEDVNYMVVNAESLEDSMHSIFYEYAHFLIRERQGSVPLWVGEGLAEFYATTEPQDGGRSVTVGLAPGRHVVQLRSSTMLSIQALRAVDHNSLIYNGGFRRGLLSAQSWALVHYLTLGNTTRAPQFRNYLSAMLSGSTDEQAFAAAFDNAASLDSELVEYVRRFTFPAVRLTFPDKSASTSVPRGKALDTGEADAYLAAIQARLGRVDEARARAAAILKRNPKVGRAFMVLGVIALRDKDVSAAAGHMNNAAALAPDDFIVQSIYGRSLVAQISDARNDAARAAQLLAQARPALMRATTLDPRSARASGALGTAELLGGGDLAVASAALEKAVQLSPREENYRLMLAQVRARQGDLDGATTLLGPLMGAGRTAEMRATARRVLGVVADMRLAREKRSSRPPVTAPLITSSEAAAPERPAVPTSPAPVPSSSSVDMRIPAETRREVARDGGLLLRAVQPGEQRVLGVLEAVECANGSVVFRVASNGRTLALRAAQFADVEFISYRVVPPGRDFCGPQKSRDRVYATYRPDGGTAGIDGIAVAVELLPDDFVPPPGLD